jgi:hypothetical protein
MSVNWMRDAVYGMYLDRSLGDGGRMYWRPWKKHKVAYTSPNGARWLAPARRTAPTYLLLGPRVYLKMAFFGELRP